MIKLKRLITYAASIIALSSFAHLAAATTLEDVVARDELACGVSEGVPGFSNPDSDGRWVGLDVDMCRAIAAAVLGDGEKIRFVPLASKQKIIAVTSAQVDLTSRTTTWTMKRDTKEGADFTAIVFYDGQGFMARASAGIDGPQSMDGASVCVTTGTTTELNLADYGRSNNISLEAVVFEGKKEAFGAYASGRCDIFTTDSSQLAAFRTTLPDSSEHIILPQIISKEPLSPLVRHGDNQWKDIVTWVLHGLIGAEEKGITAANVASMKADSKDPSIQRMLGTSGEMGSFIGLDSDWLTRAISTVGNYGEIYERNLTSTLGLQRGINAQWNQGGILYAPPIR